MSLFFGKKKSPLIKQAESAVQMADKVINYRRDVLSEAAVRELIAAREEVAALFAAATGRRYKPRFAVEGQGSLAGQGNNTTKQGEGAPANAASAHSGASALLITDKTQALALLEPALEKTGNLLRKHGGRIYPNTFGAENIEMLVVAAILAIGIRSFFFQPFKIPTNSMWPTYAGMIPVVYQLDEDRPGAVQRAVNRVLYWSSNYYIASPATGEVIIPVITAVSDKGAEARLQLPANVEGSQLFGLRKVPLSSYQLLVGDTSVEIDVPQDFPLDPVVLETYFPGYDSFQAVLTDYRAKGKVEIKARMGSNVPVYLIRTGVQVQRGQPILDFDIKTGDMLFVDRFSYNFVKPAVGEPIVFRTQNIPGLRTALSERGPFLPDERYYIKRLVGEGGDTLSIDGTTLLRNGEPVTGASAFGLNAAQKNDYPGYEARWALAPGKSETVRDGYFYAMGDNSPESYDSRGWGYDFGGRYIDKRTPDERSAGVPDKQVPMRDVVGKAMFIFYPFEPRWGAAK